VTEIVGNRAIENAAIAFVIAYEASQGRTAADTRGKGAPADVESSDGRIIEVKAYGTSGRGQDLWLEARQVAEAESNPNFWVYVVYNVRQGDPGGFGLRLLGGAQLARLVAKKRLQTTYTIPFPVAEYDKAPKTEQPD
jgi:Protein NO VEIN, C-terminal